MMKRLILSVSTLLMLGACTFVRDELHTGGGGFGARADHAGYLPAQGYPKLQVYRQVVSMVLVSKLAEMGVNDAQSADAFVNFLVATNGDVNNLAGHVFTTGQSGNGTCNLLTSPQSRREGSGPQAGQEAACTNYRELFESDLPPVEEHMFRLALSSMPRAAISSFANDARNGNFLGALLTLLRHVGRYAWGLHNAAAAARSERIIYAELVRLSDGGESSGGIERVQDAYVALADPSRSNPAYLARVNGQLEPRHLEPLYFLIRDACRHLVQASEADVRNDPTFTARVAANNAASIDEELRKELDIRHVARARQCDSIVFNPIYNRYSPAAQPTAAANGNAGGQLGTPRSSSPN